ncbi:TlpA disulfide reductase family protein [Emticicia sp. TH156]|uniref:TlpA family protein disulfide reductase n=1 Tax=Emticicia sp. TH156 TaxID=2067454 RepID=UPI000C787988|nr:TlpA disulfide reductase family protein [Emticicia sp. TH156]PLK44967.1 hypothetical protein C0V77_06895 [Emticicia sp. TH156]
MNVQKYVRALLCLYFSLSIHHHLTAQSLKVGEKIPPELWHLPLKVANHPEGKQTLTLHEYKEKLIILDFWATWCATCIKSLNKLDTLQKEFGSTIAVLPLTYEKAASALSAFKKRKWTLPTIVEDTLLKGYFPHRSIPHQVWVKGGKVLAITGPEYSTRENMTKAVKNEKINIPFKEENISFDPAIPLLVEGNGGGSESLLFQSVISKRINAKIGGWGFNKKGFSIYNCDAKLLYWNAYQDIIPWHDRESRIIFEIDSSLRSRLDYSFFKDNIDRGDRTMIDQWLEENTYCYNLVLPFEPDRNTLLNRLKADLALFFPRKLGIQSQTEVRRMLCYSLTTQPHQHPQQNHVNPAGKTLRHFFNNIAYANGKSDKPFYLDIDENLSENSRITVPDSLDLKNLKEVNRLLNLHGFALKEQYHLLQVLVIKPFQSQKL